MAGTTIDKGELTLEEMLAADAAQFDENGVHDAGTMTPEDLRLGKTTVLTSDRAMRIACLEALRRQNTGPEALLMRLLPNVVLDEETGMLIFPT